MKMTKNFKKIYKRYYIIINDYVYVEKNIIVLKNILWHVI